MQLAPLVVIQYEKDGLISDFSFHNVPDWSILTNGMTASLISTAIKVL